MINNIVEYYTVILLFLVIHILKGHLIKIIVALLIIIMKKNYIILHYIEGGFLQLFPKLGFYLQRALQKLKAIKNIKSSGPRFENMRYDMFKK